MIRNANNYIYINTDVYYKHLRIICIMINIRPDYFAIFSIFEIDYICIFILLA